MRERVRVEIHAHRGEQAARLDVHPRGVNRPGETPAEFASEEDVLGDVEVRHQREFLKDHGDAQAARVRWRCDAHRLPQEQELTAVRMVRAAERLHQRRFAGAVLPEQDVDLTGVDRQRDVIERTDAGKRFRDAAHLQQR